MKAREYSQFFTIQQGQQKGLNGSTPAVHDFMRPCNPAQKKKKKLHLQLVNLRSYLSATES
jgi:hypothetical protein